MRKILAAALSAGILTGLTGCAPMLIATGAAAGYAISRDSMVMTLNNPWMHVWQAALEEAKSQGLIKWENMRAGKIAALVQDVDVAITLKQLTPSTIRVTVRARKHLLPKVDIAQQVGLGISRRLDQGTASGSNDLD
jgi:hypothetical protein